MVFGSPVGVVLRARGGRNLLVQAHGLDARVVRQAAAEAASVLEGDAPAGMDLVDAGFGAQAALACGHLRVLNNRFAVVYRLLHQVLVVVVARAHDNVFASLSLASAACRLLVAEAKSVELTPARVLKRYAQVYLSVDALVSRGSLDLVGALLDANAALDALSPDGARKSRARQAAERAAAAAAAAAKQARGQGGVGRRVPQPHADHARFAFAAPAELAALQVQLPQYPLPPLPEPDRPLPSGAEGRVLPLEEEEEGKEGELAADEEEPQQQQPVSALLQYKGAPLALLEAWQVEVVGGRVARAGLVGAVRWAAPEAKVLAGSTPFRVLPPEPAQQQQQQQQQQQAGADGAADDAAAGTPAAAEAAGAPAAAAAAGAPAAAAADWRVLAALKCARASRRGTKHGAALGAFVADVFSPAPPMEPLLQYSLPATYGLPPLLARLSVGFVERGGADVGSGSSSSGGKGKQQQRQRPRRPQLIALVALQWQVPRELAHAAKDLTIDLRPPVELGDPRRIDPPNALWSPAQRVLRWSAAPVGPGAGGVCVAAFRVAAPPAPAPAAAGAQAGATAGAAPAAAAAAAEAPAPATPAEVAAAALSKLHAVLRLRGEGATTLTGVRLAQSRTSGTPLQVEPGTNGWAAFVLARPAGADRQRVAGAADAAAAAAAAEEDEVEATPAASAGAEAAARQPPASAAAVVAAT